MMVVTNYRSEIACVRLRLGWLNFKGSPWFVYKQLNTQPYQNSLYLKYLMEIGYFLLMQQKPLRPFLGQASWAMGQASSTGIPPDQKVNKAE
jgi:hypothetical protein